MFLGAHSTRKGTGVTQRLYRTLDWARGAQDL